MNEQDCKKNSSGDSKLRFLADIERLFLEGHRNGEIAVMLDSTALVVARNLREIKKRWTRAAARQRHTHELAVAMNRDVQRIIGSQAYHRLFPGVRLATPGSPRGLFLPRRTMGFFESDTSD